MAFQPFALDEYFEDMIKGGISQGKSTEDWFQDRADEASMDLADQAAALKRKMANASGIFGKKGRFGKFGPWMKTLIPIITTAALGPGAGAIVGTSMATADTTTRQKQLKNRLKDLKKKATQKGKYAGTFLQDYMEKGLLGLKDQTIEGLEGLKKADLISGLVDMGLSAIPGFKGGDAAKEVGKEAGKEAAEKSLKESLDKGLKALFGDKTALDFATNYAGESIVDQGLGSSIEGLATDAGKEAARTNILTGLTNKLGPLGNMVKDSSYYKMADFATNPLLGSGTSLDNPFRQRLLSAATTPSAYSGIAREQGMNYLNPNDVEPTVVRAQNPYNRYRG
tara:strand:+ start:1738 stop:2751 length:1014 start_codon:yes stop_codon:yes gene_type:complete